VRYRNGYNLLRLRWQSSIRENLMAEVLKRGCSLDGQFAALAIKL
jgi:hypothetical protein